MRTVLLFILCLSLLLQGGAPAAAAPVCDMMYMVQEAMPADAPVEPADMDCCNDAATFARTGELCKTDSGCQGSGNGLLIPPLVIASPPDIGTAIAVSSMPPLPRDLASIWRPPTLS